MNFLNKINSFYSKYLFLIVPTGTVIISVLELCFGNNPQYRNFAYIFIAVLSLLFLYRYIASNKENTGFCLVQLTYLFIVLALSVGTLLHVSNTVWMVLSAILVFLFLSVLVFCLQVKGNEIAYVSSSPSIDAAIENWVLTSLPRCDTLRSEGFSCMLRMAFMPEAIVTEDPSIILNERQRRSKNGAVAGAVSQLQIDNAVLGQICS